MLVNILTDITLNKIGVEIGGPSETGEILYKNSNNIDTLGDVFMISGCTDLQTSADSVFNNKANGAMTWSLLEGLKQNPNCSNLYCYTSIYSRTIS